MNSNSQFQARRLKSIPRPDKSSVLILPLGGTDRVGMNMTLMGHAGRWILIDAGATFPGADDDLAQEVGSQHGGEVEQIIPDLRAIESILHCVDGIVVTHAHEDHIGAFPGLYGFVKAWPELANIPIFATRYCAEIISRKLAEVAYEADIRTIEEGVPFRIGRFQVTPTRVTHSAPETQMLAIKSPIGTIVFGSDIKLDPSPLLGLPTDVDALNRLGDEKVLACLLDSTNASRDGRSASEDQVSRGIETVMASHSGRVVVSTFASNLARVVGVSRAAINSGRYLAAAGRSIFSNADAARAVGVLGEDELNFADNAFVMEQDPAYAAVVCTGTQAEQGAALTRAAEDLEQGRRHSRRLRLAPGDLVIHSARSIPGNEQSIQSLFHTLRRHGVSVLDADNGKHIVHASGHAKRAELEDFYRMLRPKFAIPVHGDGQLIEAHLDLVSERGIPALAPHEGDILSINQDGISIIGRIQVGQLATLTIGSHRDGHTRLIAWHGARPLQMDRYALVSGYGVEERAAQTVEPAEVSLAMTP